MAKVCISYNCGCGFTSANLVEAVLHSDDKHHSLDVVGRIVKDRNTATYLVSTEKED